MLKGNTVRTTPPVVRQDVIEIPKEIWELHKDVTLAIDIFFVNKIPFFITYSLVICFLSVTHLSNRKALTIFDELKSMCSFYLQQDFKLTLLRATGNLLRLKFGWQRCMERQSLTWRVPMSTSLRLNRRFG